MDVTLMIMERAAAPAQNVSADRTSCSSEAGERHEPVLAPTDLLGQDPEHVRVVASCADSFPTDLGGVPSPVENR